MNRKTILYFILIMSLAACVTPYGTRTPQRNVSPIYNPGYSNLNPEYVVYHENDTISKLVARINPRQLIVTTANKKHIPQSKLRIRYRLYPSAESMKILDSASVIYVIDKHTTKNNFLIYMQIRVKEGSAYALHISATDLFRNSTHHTFIHVDKTSKYTAQNYTVILQKDQSLSFKNYFHPSEPFRVQNYRIKPKTLFISKFYFEYPLAPPPFAIKETKPYRLRPDSFLIVNNDTSAVFSHHKPSMFFFQVDTTKNEGIITNYFHPFFPDIKTAKQLARPLQYLTSSKEFKSIMQAASKKKAVDEFWLKTAGNMSRAREMIRVYYNRVVYANKYFTSFTEGWRTDRGMIYIVFGLPKTIYKYENSEKWVYGNERSFRPIIFTFNKVDNPFSDNHFVLKRETALKSGWYNAVNAWRNGQIYTVEQ